MPVKTLDDFDSGLHLVGGRSSIPPNALRVSTGTNPVHGKSIRSRNANTRIDTNPAISAARHNGHTYTVDNNGNIRRDGSIIKSGLTPGARVSFMKSPPHFGANSFLFVLGGGGSNNALKIDDSGAVTNWGLVAPADGATATIASQIVATTINDFNSTAGLTVTGGTLGTDTSEFITGTASVTLAVNNKTLSTIKQVTALNFNTAGTTDQDTFQFYLQIDKPDYVKSIVVQFAVNAGFTHLYHVSIPIADYISNQGTISSQDVANLDAVASSLYNNPTNVPFLSYNQMEQEYATALTSYQQSRAGVNAAKPPVFKPSLGALQKAQDIGITVTPAPGGWWLISIPRSAFKAYGFTGNQWASVTGWRMKFLNRHTTDGLNFWLDGFTFGGGTGMLGDYQYIYTYTNSATGSYSQSNPTPITLQAVARSPVTLASLPTSASDAQIDTLTIWRTMGNGGIYYRLVDIPLSTFAGTFLDVTSDFFGYGPSPTSLPNYATTTTYGQNALVKPTSGNAGGYVYAAITPGTTGAGAPTWPQNIGAKVTDSGGVVWQNVGATLALGIESYLPVNILPSTTATQCVSWHGSMFLCGDTAEGQKGRIYYSAAGYQEGVAGYTDITNDDDPTTGFGIYNDNLYVFTKKGMWQVIDISVNAFLPGYTVVQQQGSPGCTAPFSIVSTPNALVFQDADLGLHAFDGYFTERIGGAILPLCRGDTVEGYAAIGTIVAACFGRDEYWFSDGSNNLFCINLMPGSIVGQGHANTPIRVHSTLPALALYYEHDTGKVLAGWNGGTYHLEEFGSYNADDGTATLPFALRPASIYSGIKYSGKGQRILLDINCGGNTFSVYVSVDGVDKLLSSSVTGSSRGIQEFPFNLTGHVIGAYITTNGGSGQCEVFGVAIEGDISGMDDTGSQGGPSPVKQN